MHEQIWIDAICFHLELDLVDGHVHAFQLEILLEDRIIADSDWDVGTWRWLKCALTPIRILHVSTKRTQIHENKAIESNLRQDRSVTLRLECLKALDSFHHLPFLP